MVADVDAVHDDVPLRRVVHRADVPPLGRLPPDVGRQSLRARAGAHRHDCPGGWTHSGLAVRIVALLDAHVRRHRLGRVFESSLGYILPSGDVLEPDASFVSTRRFEADRPSRPNEYLRAVPNLVVEILSPGTAVRDRGEKKDLYEQGGVDEYWIVDSDHRAVTVFTAGRVWRRPNGNRRRAAFAGIAEAPRVGCEALHGLMRAQRSASSRSARSPSDRTRSQSKSPYKSAMSSSTARSPAARAPTTSV
jgi:hypothetical protein